MGWLTITLWIIGIIAVILIVMKVISSRPTNHYSTGGKMSFADSMRKVGKSIGDCCRKFGA